MAAAPHWFSTLHLPVLAEPFGAGNGVTGILAPRSSALGSEMHERAARDAANRRILEQRFGAVSGDDGGAADEDPMSAAAIAGAVLWQRQRRAASVADGSPSGAAPLKGAAAAQGRLRRYESPPPGGLEELIDDL